MFRNYTLQFFLILLTLSGCRSNPYNIDISDIKIDQKFYRFDQELFEINHDSVWNYVPVFEKKYGSFFDLYNQAIIKIGGTNEMGYANKLIYFITDPYISEAQVEATRLFKNDKVETEIYEAFCRYHYYFPDKAIPNIYTHISGFNQSIVIDSGFISISLDKYLGADSKFYSMLHTPYYLRYAMFPEKVPSDALFAWGLTEFPYVTDNDILSNQMIYYGKMQVFLDAMLPNVPDSIKWGIPEQKLLWCSKNETQMWLYLIENKLLFNSSFKEIKRFIDDGPFTTPFSKESPSRTGRWIGYQIVKSYVKHHPNVTLPQLMAMHDYQKILNESRYKP